MLTVKCMAVAVYGMGGIPIVRLVLTGWSACLAILGQWVMGPSNTHAACNFHGLV